MGQANGALAPFAKNYVLVFWNILKNEFQNCDNLYNTNKGAVSEIASVLKMIA
jgi:hypothetical protein